MGKNSARKRFILLSCVVGYFDISRQGQKVSVSIFKISQVVLLVLLHEYPISLNILGRRTSSLFSQTYNHPYKDAFKSDLLNLNDHLEIHSWCFSPLKVFSLSTSVCGISSELISSCRVKMPFEPFHPLFPHQTYKGSFSDDYRK